MFTVNWLLPEITDTERQMELGLLAVCPDRDPGLAACARR